MSSDRVSIGVATTRKAIIGMTWLSAGKVASGIIGFLTNALMVSILGPTAYGIATLVFTFSGLLSSLGSFITETGLVTTIVNARTRRNYSEAYRILTIATVSGLIFGILVSLISIQFTGALSEFLKVPEDSNMLLYGYLLLIAIMLRIISISAVTSLQGFRILVLMKLLSNLIRSLIFILTSHLGPESLILASFFSDSSIAILGLSYSFTKLYGMCTSNVSTCDDWIEAGKKLFSFNSYLYASNITKAVVARVNIFLLNAMGSPLWVGYYQAAVKLSTPFLSLITSTTNTVLLPILSDIYSRGKTSTLKKMIAGFLKIELALTLPMTLSLIVLMDLILISFFPSFVPVSPLFKIMSLRLVIGAIRSILNPICLLAMNKPEKRMTVSMVNGGTSLVASLILVLHFGLYGAILSAIFREVFGLYLSYFEVRKALTKSLSIGSRFSLRVLVSSLIMAVSVHILQGYLIPNVVSLLLSLVLGIVVFVVAFRYISPLDSSEIEVLYSVGSFNPFVKRSLLYLFGKGTDNPSQ